MSDLKLSAWKMLCYLFLGLVVVFHPYFHTDLGVMWWLSYVLYVFGTILIVLSVLWFTAVFVGKLSHRHG